MKPTQVDSMNALRVKAERRARVLEEALRAAQRAINSMKVEAETGAVIGDEQGMLDACNTISQEGLEADMAIRAVLGTRGVVASEPPSDPNYCEHGYKIGRDFCPYCDKYTRGVEGKTK